MPDNLVYLGIFRFINNLYANSLLVMLNARDNDFFNTRPGHSNNLATNLALTDFLPVSASSQVNSSHSDFPSAASKLVFVQSREQESIINVSSKVEGD
ncbi:hypothetical protein OF83DRAFT_1176399 [Amylostereum chailletii]|nr:hypothetical protein OF83DRAFT_1176399 [Amylostereum chailletii]